MKKLFLLLLIVACNNKKESTKPAGPTQSFHFVAMTYTAVSTPVEVNYTAYNGTSGYSPALFSTSDTIYYDQVSHLSDGSGASSYYIKAKATGSVTVKIYIDNVINQSVTAIDSAIAQVSY